MTLTATIALCVIAAVELFGICYGVALQRKRQRNWDSIGKWSVPETKKES